MGFIGPKQLTKRQSLESKAVVSKVGIQPNRQIRGYCCWLAGRLARKTPPAGRNKFWPVASHLSDKRRGSFIIGGAALLLHKSYQGGSYQNSYHGYTIKLHAYSTRRTGTQLGTQLSPHFSMTSSKAILAQPPQLPYRLPAHYPQCCPRINCSIGRCRNLIGRLLNA
jgi:hypothetical protein